MTLRHAAVLALVGWYLMLPPKLAPFEVEADAPLSHWTLIASFDTSKECGNYRMAEVMRYRMNPENKQEAWNEKAYLAALCIATDDPRLKPK